MPTVTYTTIGTTTLSTANSQITLSGIPATYKHLRFSFTSANDSSNMFAYYRFNGSSSAQYNTMGIRWYNNGLYAPRDADGTYITLGYFANTGTTPRSNAVIDVYDYASTTFGKVGLHWQNAVYNASNNSNIERTGTSWTNTGAITSITITTSIGSFNPGTTLTVYGLV